MTKAAARFLALLTFALSVSAADYKIVVHRSNSITSMTKTEVADYLMKRKKVWANQKAVVPVDQSADAVVRQRFSLEILGRPIVAIKSYWNQQIFSGREVPPVEQPGDRQVLEFIKSTPGAVGYVSATADTAEVKVITLR